MLHTVETLNGIADHQTKLIKLGIQPLEGFRVEDEEHIEGEELWTKEI